MKSEQKPKTKKKYPKGAKLTPAQQKQLDATRAEWDERFKPMMDGIRDAGKITEEDLQIRVGPCPDLEEE